MALEYSTVRINITTIAADGIDVDDIPDDTPLTGSLELTPMIAAGSAIQYDDGGTLKLKTVSPITVDIGITGDIDHHGRDYVKVLAPTASTTNLAQLQWRASFKNLRYGSQVITMQPIYFYATPGAEINLADNVNVAPSSLAVQLSRGPRGFGIGEIVTDVATDELVFKLDDDSATEVGRVEMPDFIVSDEFVADLVAPGTATKAALDGTYGRVDAIQFAGLPTIFHDFVGMENGATAPVVTDSGHPVYWNSVPPFFTGNDFASLTPGGATYFCTEDLGETVTHVRARYKIAPNGGGNGGLCCIAITDRRWDVANIANTNMGLHLWVTPTAWSLTVWEAATGQQTIDYGFFDTRLTVDGVTEYMVQCWIVGDKATVILPNGKHVTKTDPRFASLSGNYAFFESMINHADDDLVCISAVGAGTGKTRTPWIPPATVVTGTVSPAPAKVPLNSIMALGDSLTAVVSPYDPTTGYDSHNGGPNGGHSACDWLFQGNLLADSAMNVLGGAATAGYTAEQIRDTHLPTILAAKPTYCVVQAGANNALGDGEFPNSTLAVVEGICASLVAAGITPILATFPPATIVSLSQNEIDRMNTWASEYAHRNGYPLLDFYNALVDHSTGAYKAGYTTDNLHPTSLGSAAQALVVRDVIKKISTTGSRAALAGFNASGVVGSAVNPLLAPAAGEPNRPDGWFIMGEPTLSLAASTIAGNELTVTRTAETALLFGNDIDCSEGDIWDFCCRIGTTPGASGAFTFGILDQTGGNFVVNAYDHRLAVPDGTILHWRGRTPAGVTKLRSHFAITAGVGAKMKISQVTLRNLTAKGLAS